MWFSFGIGWIEEVVTGKLGPIPYQCLKALSEMNFGRMENVKELKVQGTKLYGTALQAMIGALGRSQVQVQELLLPSILLMMYAVYYPYRQWEDLVENREGSIGNWGENVVLDRMAAVSHIAGIGKILEASRPAAFQNKWMRKVLDCARISTVRCVWYPGHFA